MNRFTNSKVRSPIRISPIIQDSKLLYLPASVLQNICSYLTFEEVSNIRLVCRDFAVVADYVLHTGFQKIGPNLEKSISKIHNDSFSKNSEKHIIKYHVLYLVTVEYKFLRAVCWRYIRTLEVCFFPGRLLDYFYRIIRITTEEDRQQDKSVKFSVILMDIVEELIFLVEKFILFFENHVESTLWPNTKQIGVKILDLLDCCLGSRCNLTLVYSRMACKVSGCYCCPLTGYFTCVQDDGQLERQVRSEKDLNLWLTGLRTLIRNSNHMYIEEIINSMQTSNCSQQCRILLFDGRKVTTSRKISGDGNTYFEAFEKKLEPGKTSKYGNSLLSVKIRVQFPLWQWPMELGSLGNALSQMKLFGDHCNDKLVAEFLDDLVHAGYPIFFPEKKPDVYDGCENKWKIIPDRSRFLMHCEVFMIASCRGIQNVTQELRYIPGQIIILNPSQYLSQGRKSRCIPGTNMVSTIREIRMTPTEEDEAYNISVVIGRLDYSQSTKTFQELISSKLLATQR